jgi:bacterioferritin
MGKLARDLAHPTEEVLSELRRAYADEWFAHFNYYTVSKQVTGPSAASLAELLRHRSERAFGRAERLGDRLVQLGGELPSKLVELTEYATDKPFKLPDDLSDLPGLLRAVLDAERTTLRLQHHIYGLARDKDPVTAALALDLMAEAERGEQQLQTLLGEEAPEMTGT